MVRRSTRTFSATAVVQEMSDDLLELAPPSKLTRKAVKQPPHSPPSTASKEARIDPIAKRVADQTIEQPDSFDDASSELSSAAEMGSLQTTKRSKPKPKPPKTPKEEPPTHFETRVNVHGEEYQVELDEEGDAVKRNKNGRRLPKRKKKDVVHVIPDIPTRDFRLEGPPEKRQERSNGFTGELGYACLNTVLRSQDPPIFSSRTARIKTMEEQGPDYVKQLGRLNARDIIPMIFWNEENGIKFMRLSSEVFPFASHKKYGYSLKYAEKELRAAGDLAKKLGHRLTMHPGQFTQLGSNRPEVIESSIRDLNAHCEMLDLMGLDQNSVIIIHGGGTFGDRAATLDRMRQTYITRLSDNVKRRLVLENDEMSWSAEELLPLCIELDIPMVFDFHHDLLRPSSRPPAELLAEIQAIWHKKGMRPKYHLSEPRPGSTNWRERRAHSDRCGVLPPDLPADAHLMIEAKDKEQAVFELRRIYQLRPVRHDSLRPPAKDIGVKTSGRKAKLGGERLPRRRTKSKADSNANGLEKADATADDTGSGGPVKSGAKRLSKAERAIAKAKEAAKRLGKVYTGPGADIGDDEGVELAAARPGEEGYVKSSLEVLHDMHVEAEWIRAELRAGRERRPYGTQPDPAAIDDAEEVVDEDGEAQRPPASSRTRARSRKNTKTEPNQKRMRLADDGQQIVLAQRAGAPEQELVAGHEAIALRAPKARKKGLAAERTS